MWGWLRRHLLRQPAENSLGGRGEDLAANFLRSLGYRILERQMRGRYGELDLIALDGESIVFVEVKTRSSSVAGDPTDAITSDKQRKITQSALEYLKRRRWLDRRVRFDVIAILWNGNHPPDIRHYPSAFDASGFGQMYS